MSATGVRVSDEKAGLEQIGESQNKFYKEKGSNKVHDPYKFRDSFGLFRIDDNNCLYSVFTNHQDFDVASSALSNIVLDITENSLVTELPEKKIKQILQHAFDDAQAMINVQELSLNSSNKKQKLTVGYSAVVVFIHFNNLYTCIIGNKICRALLCQNDRSNVIRPIEVNGSQNSAALDVTGPVPLNKDCRYLLLMSIGLCKSLHDMYGPHSHREFINKEIVQLVLGQFRKGVNDVAQQAVNEVADNHCRVYDRQFEEHGFNRLQDFKMREDMTLLIRTFNKPTAMVSTTDENEINMENSDETQHLEASNDENIVEPYVDFTSYNNRVKEARLNNSLPKGFNFD